MSTHTLEEVLHPQSIAVVGASDSPTGRGYGFLAPLLEFGFKGEIYPVNPKYSEILGLKTYPRVKDIPGSVDFVISAVPSSAVLEMLEDCSQKGVKGIHLYTARFSETGRPDAVKLEQEILKKVKQAGIRMIGPNCLGVYYPKQGISFEMSFPKEPGSIGLISQTGGGARSFIPSASKRGIRFSKAISYGNAIDFNESDYLDYLSKDPETKLILMYIEGVKDGKRFLSTLRQATPIKPVIIIKGGRGESGTRAVASHTASLAGSMQIWETAVTQAGAISARSFDEMADLAVSFSFLPPIKGRNVGVAGGAGGASVLAADLCEEAGLDIIPLPTEIREELKSKDIPIWDWIGNPADTSISIGDFRFTPALMLQIMAKNKNFDLLLSIMGTGIARRQGQPEVSVDEYLAQFKQISDSKSLLAVVGESNLGAESNLGIDDYDEWKKMCEVITKLIDLKIPVYPSVGRAARAASKMISYYEKRDKQQSST
ncbi:acetate--CoA ligase family protein [Chloroflexota bacterium]